MTWQWWINQAFALIGLILVVISFQCKTTKKLIWLRNIATLSVFTGLCVLGNVSAIIMCGAGVIRNAVSLVFAYRPNTKNIVKIVSGCLIVVLLIVLNIVFWNNYMNIFSIVIGSVNVYTFLQSKPSTIRKCSIFAEILAITYYGILLSPTNVAIEVVGLVSAIIGMIRLDRVKKEVIIDNEVKTNNNEK